MDVTPYPVCENPSTTYVLDAADVATARAEPQGQA